MISGRLDYLPKEKAKIYREELGPKMQNMLKTMQMMGNQNQNTTLSRLQKEYMLCITK